MPFCCVLAVFVHLYELHVLWLGENLHSVFKMFVIRFYNYFMSEKESIRRVQVIENNSTAIFLLTTQGTINKF